MADEATENVEQEESAQEEETQVETQTAETEQPQEEAQEEVVAEEEAQNESTESVQPQKRRLKHKGEEVEVDDEEYERLASAGFDYTKKMQALSEMEKVRQQQDQLNQFIMSDPDTMKYAMARKLGYDPNMVLGNVPAPDPQYKEQFPEWYGEQLAIHKMAQQQKAAFENMLNGMVAFNAQSANNAVFEKAKLEHDLTDEQSAQVKQFVTDRMRTNQAGFYTSDDVKYAVNALFGADRQASALLKQANTITKTIKKAAPKPGTSRKTVQELSPEVSKAVEFRKFTEDMSRTG